MLGDPHKAVGCVGLAKISKTKPKKWEEENTASLQRETDQQWVIHTTESHLSTGIRFISTVLSEEEQAAGGEIQVGTTRADLRHTTQGLPLFMDTDGCGETTETQMRLEQVRVRVGFHMGWGWGWPCCVCNAPLLPKNLQHVCRTLIAASCPPMCKGR